MKGKIAVLGGGGTGHTMAADLTLAGHEVTLYEEPRHKESLRSALELGGVSMTGAGRQGLAKIHKITTNIEEALKNASTIFVAVVASRHERIAEICSPFLNGG